MEAAPTQAVDVPHQALPLADAMYHERQVARFCGLHAVNNMLQRKAYRHQELDAMEEELGAFDEEVRRWNCARLTLWCLCQSVGRIDFGVQTLTLALARQGLELQWFDRRKQLAELKLDDPVLVGVILNLQVATSLLRRVCSCTCCGSNSSRHWLSIRRMGDVFYNLNSTLRKPQSLGGTEATLAWLQGELTSEQSCVFRVIQMPGRPSFLPFDGMEYVALESDAEDVFSESRRIAGSTPALCKVLANLFRAGRTPLRAQGC